jgi:hypothetical protein
MVLSQSLWPYSCGSSRHFHLVDVSRPVKVSLRWLARMPSLLLPLSSLLPRTQFKQSRRLFERTHRQFRTQRQRGARSLPLVRPFVVRRRRLFPPPRSNLESPRQSDVVTGTPSASLSVNTSFDRQERLMSMSQCSDQRSRVCYVFLNETTDCVISNSGVTKVNTNAAFDLWYVQCFEGVPNEEGVGATSEVEEFTAAPTSSPTMSSSGALEATVFPIFSFVMLLVALI